MKKAIMYGGGNIGRGFIGKVFSDSGYEVVFLDIMQDMIDEFNARGKYTVRIVSNEATVDETVAPVRAVNSTTEQALDEIVTCDIMATAVGVNILPRVAPAIAKAIIARMEKTGKKLNIILCENQLEVDIMMRGWLYQHMTKEQQTWCDENLGLIEPSIGRMVPPLTPEMRAQDKLLICVEPYSELPVDKDAFKGEIPDLVGLVPYSPFEFYIKRKLFLHNGGHALCAYLGNLKGYEYIWQAIQDPEIYEAAKASMLASAHALIAKFGEGVRANVEENVVDLLKRFENRALKDTVARVGADPVRKLRRNDRVVGAALFCMEQGVDPTPIIKGILAALKFDRADDATAPEVQKALKEQGIEYVLSHYMGLAADEPLYGMIREAYENSIKGEKIMNYTDYIVEETCKILAVDSPSGFTDNCVDFVMSELRALGYAPVKTIKGGVIVDLGGKDVDNGVLLETHLDTLGGMVTEIKGNGRLKITNLGGMNANNAETENVKVYTKFSGVYEGTLQMANASIHVNGEYNSTPRNWNTVEVVLDEIVSSKDDVKKLGIRVGDFVCFDPRTRVTEKGYIKSRFLDDKLSVGILMGYAKYLKEENITPERRVYGHITIYEEVGHGGSASVPAGVTEAISVDMGCVGNGLDCTERTVSICAKDSGGPYSYSVVSGLIAAADKAGVEYAVDVYPFYGSDVEGTLRAGYDIKHGLIGPGVYASHGYERSHKDGVENTFKLLCAYLG